MRIDVLSATADPDARAGRLLEESKQWPTRENVISRLEAIITSANPGDFVYVHFSGHGTQLPPVSSEVQKHRSTRELALVLIGGPDGKSIRCFRGLELAYYLKKMVSKGLKVNMVLDCCFSGSVPRGEQDASRFLPYDSTVDDMVTASSSAILDESYAELDSRDGSLLPNWVVNPDGYTILTACGPHETAMEVKLANQQHAGALSHILLRTLSNLGNVDAKMGDLYQYVCTRFVDRRQSADWLQTPMFYGNKNLSFFGVLKTTFDPSSITVFRSVAGNLMLRAGQAHGVFDQDKIDLCPIKSSADLAGDTSSVMHLRVEKAGPLTSILGGLGCNPVPKEVGEEWIAKAVSPLLLRAVPIWVSGSGLDKLQEAAEKRPVLLVHKTAQNTWPDSFGVTLNTQNEYEIKNDSGEVVARFSFMSPSDHGQAITQVLDALQHLTRFKQMQAISNTSQSSTIQDSFSVRIRAGDWWHDCKSTIQTSNNGELELEIVNSGQKPLYFHIYNMGPLWQVENIFGGHHEVIVPKNSSKGFTGIGTWTLEMRVPNESIDMGKKSCHDIIKIFVTDEPTSFDILVMNALSATSSSNAGQENLTQLPIFHSEFGSGATRSDAGDWAVVNIHIHTSV